MNLNQAAGRHLVIGVQGKRVTGAMVRQFEMTEARGLILFIRNFDSPGQVKRLVGELRRRLGRPLFVMVDQEGGRVIRFTKGITQFPDALAIGKGGIDFVKRQGRIEARELGALGINMNLAPVLDVLTEKENPVIGTRSYGHDFRRVARFAQARIRAMQLNGLWACAKHFPGIGEAELDPHHELPTISTSKKLMERIHLFPFRAAIRAGVCAVMSSHVLYPCLDSSKSHPATFSRKIIHDLLREKLKFKGLVLTDDLEMGALRKFGAVGDLAVRAVRAGHDRVLVCEDSGKQRQAFEALKRAYRKGIL